MSNNNAIQLPEALHNNLETYREKTNFSSLNDLVTFILQDYLDQQDTDRSPENKDDEARVMKRLRDLGYL